MDLRDIAQAAMQDVESDESDIDGILGRVRGLTNSPAAKVLKDQAAKAGRSAAQKIMGDDEDSETVREDLRKLYFGMSEEFFGTIFEEAKSNHDKHYSGLTLREEFQRLADFAFRMIAISDKENA